MRRVASPRRVGLFPAAAGKEPTCRRSTTPAASPKLERKIGQLTMENDFLKEPYSISGHHPPAVVSGADACLKILIKPTAKGRTVNALCNRSGFYRRRLRRQPTPAKMEISDQMQTFRLKSPACGYRRITAEWQQRGFAVNHKRVLRMMREDNVLCVRGRALVVTTNSNHHLPVYPNLERDIKPIVINQLSIADPTYIRLRAEFVYLAVVLDACSQRVIGWALGGTLEAS